MCGVMLVMIIFVLGLFKFLVILNSFTRFPSYANFIFATVSYRSSSSCCCSLAAVGLYRCSLASSSSSLAAAGSSSASFSTKSFSLSRPYPIFSIILLYKKKQYHVRSAAFLQVHLVLLPRVLIQRCIFLKLNFSKMCSSFIINLFLRNFLTILWTGKDHPMPSPGCVSILLPRFFCLFFLVFWYTPIPPAWWMPSNRH